MLGAGGKDEGDKHRAYRWRATGWEGRGHGSSWELSRDFSHCTFSPESNQRHTGRGTPRDPPFILQLRKKRHSDCPLWKGALGGNVSKWARALDSDKLGKSSPSSTHHLCDFGLVI